MFLVEANWVVVKMLDSYISFSICSFQIGMHGGFLRACLMEKSCSWKTENKVKLNDGDNFLIKYQLSTE